MVSFANRAEPGSLRKRWNFHLKLSAKLWKFQHRKSISVSVINLICGGGNSFSTHEIQHGISSNWTDCRCSVFPYTRIPLFSSALLNFVTVLHTWPMQLLQFAYLGPPPWGAISELISANRLRLIPANLFPTFRTVYNLIFGIYCKFACKNSFLSRCAQISHRLAALLRTLRWLSKFFKKIRRGSRKKQVGVLKRRIFRQCQFPIRRHEGVLLRSRSDFHVANFRKHSRIRLYLFNLIHLHWSKITNNSNMYE